MHQCYAAMVMLFLEDADTRPIQLFRYEDVLVEASADVLPHSLTHQLIFSEKLWQQVTEWNVSTKLKKIYKRVRLFVRMVMHTC